MLRAPRSDAGGIDGRYTWWHLPIVTQAANVVTDTPDAAPSSESMSDDWAGRSPTEPDSAPPGALGRMLPDERDLADRQLVICGARERILPALGAFSQGGDPHRSIHLPTAPNRRLRNCSLG